MNTSFAASVKAREDVAKFLEHIRPNDRLGLYVLRGDMVLRVVHDFTSDATTLVRAVSRLRGNVSTALAAEEDAARLDAGLADVFAGQGESSGAGMMGHFQGLRAVATSTPSSRLATTSRASRSARTLSGCRLVSRWRRSATAENRRQGRSTARRER